MTAARVTPWRGEVKADTRGRVSLGRLVPSIEQGDRFAVFVGSDGIVELRPLPREVVSEVQGNAGEA